MFGYVVTDNDNNVIGIVNEMDFPKYKIVDDIEKYNVGDVYPKPDEKMMREELADYNIAECIFVNGVNEKPYVFRDYLSVDTGDHVLVDTVYGPQIAVVKETHDRGEWKGLKPTKDIIDIICEYDEYLKRQRIRRVLERSEKNAEEKKPEKDIKVFHLDNDELDEVRKYLVDVFGSIFK